MLLNKCVTCHDASGILIVVLSEYMSFTTQFLCSFSCVPYVLIPCSCCKCGGVHQSTAADKDISNLALPMLVLHTGNNSVSHCWCSQQGEVYLRQYQFQTA